MQRRENVQTQEELGMKIVAAMVLGLGLLGTVELAAARQDKKDEKKEDKKPSAKEEKVELPKLAGKYVLVSGKLSTRVSDKVVEKPVDEAAKKWDYTFTADRITISSKDARKPEGKDEKPLMFAFSYKLEAVGGKVHIDMEIVDGPEGTKGSKAVGIIELKGETLKLAYSMDKEKRPENFEGKVGNTFELKKAK